MKVKEIIKFTEWIPNPQETVKTPKFSIMMPTYRRFASGHLTRAIQSVLNQTYHEFELIMIDDGSVDGSFDEIQRFVKLDSRIHCLRHPRNVGLPAIGCYEAFLKSRGEYLMFCFDDTEYQKDALENVEQYVSEHKPKIAFGYIDYQYRDSKGIILHSFLGKDKISQAYLKMTNFLPNLGAILHRDVPNEIGFLDPHLAVARITDWDYWKRAANVYELHYSGIHIGTEFGLVTNNSLGLTYPLNPWMAYEWTERDRNSALTPNSYEEYDVQRIPDDLSDQSKLALHDISRFYQTKFWYQQLLSLILSIPDEAVGLNRNDRVLIVTLEMDASISLAFEFIFTAKQNIRYASPAYLLPKEMISAKAVIFAGDLSSPEIHQWVEIARQLGIPHYYYIDDSFIVLSGESSGLEKYAEKNTREELASFSGVLASSQRLATFLLKNNIHPKVYLFPPVMPSDKWLDHLGIPKKAKGATRIGFMGGPHQSKDLIEFILPAIARLAKDHSVELVISGEHNISSNDYPQLKIYQFSFDTSYRLMIGCMTSATIDILVHTGSTERDNPYKNRAVLLNAWALKAFPMLTNQLPYEDVEAQGLGMLCEAGNIENWYENLLKVISDPSLVIRVSENLNKYVVNNYSGKQNLDVLKVLSNENYATGNSVIENRFRNYIDIIGSDILVNTLAVRSSVRLFRKLYYKLHIQKNGWTGFEFMIGTHNQRAVGRIEIEVLARNESEIVRRKSLEMNNISNNQIVSINFDGISNSADKDYIVRFIYQASGEKSLISIYEKNDQETKVIRFLRRLGLLTHGNTLACRIIYAET